MTEIKEEGIVGDRWWSRELQLVWVSGHKLLSHLANGIVFQLLGIIAVGCESEVHVVLCTLCMYASPATVRQSARLCSSVPEPMIFVAFTWMRSQPL